MSDSRDGEGFIGMTTKYPTDDPKGNVIEFKREKRKGTLEPVGSKWGACKHNRSTVDIEKRELTCRDCNAALDPLTYLHELATRQRRWLEELDGWDAYRESKLSERYDERWAEDHEGVLSPPANAQLRKIWDVFHAAIGEKFCRMYSRKRMKRNGPEWYGCSTDGLTISYEYAQSRLVPKAVAKGAENA